MSGATIGGVVGGVIGAFFGNPQLGYMIGSAIGGYVDPTQVEGPRLTDATQQTAQDGVPRAYGYGRFPTAGNLIWTDELKERRNKQRAKGGSTEQITYTYTRSYAIAVCRGPISGFLIIKRNGKIVFDARTDAELSALGFTSNQIAEIRAAQSKFLRKVTLYYGVAEQAPDPTIVAVNGVGNVPGYSGTAYIVVADDDLTDLRGAVPQYEFVVADCGARSETSNQGPAYDGNRWIVRGGTGTIKPSEDGLDWTTKSTLSSPNVIGYRMVLHESRVVLIPGSGEAAAPHAARDALWAWTDGPARGAGFVGTVSSPLSIDGRLWVPLGGGVVPSPPNYVVNGLAYIDDIESGSWTILPNLTHSLSPGTPSTNFIAGRPGLLLRGGNYAMHRSTDGGGVWSDAGLIPWNGLVHCGRANESTFLIGGGVGASGEPKIAYTDDGNNPTLASVPFVPNGHVLQLLHLGGFEWFAFIALGSGFGNALWKSSDNGRTFVEVDIGVAVNFNRIGAGNGDRNPFDGRVVFTAESASGQMLFVTDDNGATFDALTYTDVEPNSVMSLNQSTVAYGVPIPDAPGWYIDPLTGQIIGVDYATIDPCQPTLGEIVAEECISRNVTSIDVSELADPVIGFRVASTSSPQKNIAALIPGYFFDSSEFDGTLHFPKRGRSDSFALTMDDLVERDGDPLQWERKQEPELLRKVTVGHMDPDTTYSATTQQWERRAGTVKAEGEGTIQLPIVGSGDWAAQVAEKTGKIAWGESEECTFHLSRAWAKLVTASVGTITDQSGTVHRIRIEKIKDEGAVRMIEARRTSATLYESTAVGAQKQLPQFPGSTIHGPTLAAVMNIPAIDDAHDRPGVYWAAAGYFSNWAGGQLQVLRAGVWVALGTIYGPSSIGTLLADLPEHGGDLDTVNTMHIRINDEMENTTFPQLLSERNAVAIVYPDATVEVVQFQNVEVDTDGNYLCTNLIRGNLDTVRGAHAAGAVVVFIDQTMQFADLRPDDLGQTLTFRVVGLGTDPDAATTFDITFDRIWSSTEWPVALLAVEKDGDDYTLTWQERRRLGTDTNPIRSSNWQGYVVTYEYSGVSNQQVVTTETTTFNLPGASDIDFSVAQVNRLTSNGPNVTVNIP